jgi:soluble lytic murein transglycosylase-like protein
VAQESGYNPDAISEAGAIGLAQVMPFHAKTCGLPHAGYLKDPEINLDCGFTVFRSGLKTHKNDVHKAIQAYFGGDKCVNSPKCPKTETYAKDILRRLVVIDN